MIKSIINIDYLKISFKVNSFEVIETNCFGNEEIKYKKFSNILTFNRLFSENKYIINDSLFFTLCENPELKSTTETQVFSTYLKNKLVGYYYFDSVNKDLVFFKFDNNVFYQNKNLQSIINQLERHLHIEFYGITGIDICLNTNYNIYSPLSLIFDSCYNNPYFQNIDKINNEDFQNYGGRTIEDVKFKSVVPNLSMYQIESTIYFGQKKSGKRISVYDKSKFSTPTQKKYYNSIFGNNQTIYRIEISLRNKGKIKLNELIKISQLNDKQYLTKIFKTMVGPQFTFSDLQNFTYDNNRNKVYTKITLIDKLNLINIPIQEFEIEEIEKVTLPNRIKNYNKMYFKKMVIDYLSNGYTTINEIKDWILTRSLERGVELTNNDIPNNNNHIGILIINKMTSKEIKVNDYSKLQNLLTELEGIDLLNLKFENTYL